MPQQSQQQYTTSGSSTRVGSSSQSQARRGDPLSDYRMSEYTRRSDSTQRFLISGTSSRSQTAMAQQMKQWDSNWDSVSRRR